MIDRLPWYRDQLDVVPTPAVPPVCPGSGWPAAPEPLAALGRARCNFCGAQVAVNVAGQAYVPYLPAAGQAR